MGRAGKLNDLSLIRGGIPSLAPAQEIAIHFDSAIDRFESALPLTYTGRVRYTDYRGKQLATEEFVLDLEAYRDTAVPPRDLSDLVDDIEKIRKHFDKWNDGDFGLRVAVGDRDARTRRSDRYYVRRRVRRAFDDGGLSAAMRYVGGHIRRRLGI